MFSLKTPHFSLLSLSLLIFVTLSLSLPFPFSFPIFYSTLSHLYSYTLPFPLSFEITLYPSIYFSQFHYTPPSIILTFLIPTLPLLKILDTPPPSFLLKFILPLHLLFSISLYPSLYYFDIFPTLPLLKILDTPPRLLFFPYPYLLVSLIPLFPPSFIYTSLLHFY